MPVIPSTTSSSRSSSFDEHLDFEGLLPIARALRERTTGTRSAGARRARPYAHGFLAMLDALGIVAGAERTGRRRDGATPRSASSGARRWPSRSSPARTPASGGRPRSRSPAGPRRRCHLAHRRGRAGRPPRRSERPGAAPRSAASTCRPRARAAASRRAGRRARRPRRAGQQRAATGTIEPVLDLALDDWRRVLDVDLDGAFLCAQAAARRMVAAGRGGRIVNVTSVHEHVPLRGRGAYCAAKGGLGLLTKVMALELARTGSRSTPSPRARSPRR